MTIQILRKCLRGHISKSDIYLKILKTLVVLINKTLIVKKIKREILKILKVTIISNLF